MRYTVLGSSASYPGPGRACAGHLVQADDGTAVVFDLGNGALANLALWLDPRSLDAVFVSHLHVDHFLDLYALMALLRYAPSGPEPALPLSGPAGLPDGMMRLMSEHGREDVTAAFAWAPLADGVPIQAGGLVVTPRSVEHDGATYALVASGDGRRLCYTSDCRTGPEVLNAAEGADVLVAEASMPPGYAGPAPHMTPEAAAELATAVGASTLVLTHLWPATPRGEILDAATARFSGTVLLADEGLVVEV